MKTYALPALDDITAPVYSTHSESTAERHADFLRGLSILVSDSAISNRLDEIADFVTYKAKARVEV